MTRSLLFLLGACLLNGAASLRAGREAQHVQAATTTTDKPDEFPDESEPIPDLTDVLKDIATQRSNTGIGVADVKNIDCLSKKMYIQGEVNGYALAKSMQDKKSSPITADMGEFLTDMLKNE